MIDGAFYAQLSKWYNYTSQVKQIPPHQFVFMKISSNVFLNEIIFL